MIPSSPNIDITNVITSVIIVASVFLSGLRIIFFAIKSAYTTTRAVDVVKHANTMARAAIAPSFTPRIVLAICASSCSLGIFWMKSL